MGNVTARRRRGSGANQRRTHRVGIHRTVPDAVFVFLDLCSSAAGRDAAERRGRLRVRRDAEQQRVLLRDRPSALQGEVSDGSYVYSAALMGTVVRIEVVGHDANESQRI